MSVSNWCLKQWSEIGKVCTINPIPQIRKSQHGKGFPRIPTKEEVETSNILNYLLRVTKSKGQLSPNLMSLCLSQPLPFRLKDYHLHSNEQVAQAPPSVLLFIILIFPESLLLGHFYILNFSLACIIWVSDAVTFVSLVKLHIMSWTWRGLKTYVMNEYISNNTQVQHTFFLKRPVGNSAISGISFGIHHSYISRRKQL